MKELILTGLIAVGASGLAAAAEQSDPESKSQCVYQGQVYGIGSPISAGGKDLIWASARIRTFLAISIMAIKNRIFISNKIKKLLTHVIHHCLKNNLTQ